MEEIQKRFAETSKECMEAYEAWDSDKKTGEKRERLMAAIHELRKVTSRLEIELAISERNEQAKKPIPIPPHRSSRKKKGDNGDGNNDLPDFIKNGDDNNGGSKKPRGKSSGSGNKRPKKPDNNG